MRRASFTVSFFAILGALAFVVVPQQSRIRNRDRGAAAGDVRDDMVVTNDRSEVRTGRRHRQRAAGAVAVTIDQRVIFRAGSVYT